MDHDVLGFLDPAAENLLWPSPPPGTEGRVISIAIDLGTSSSGVSYLTRSSNSGYEGAPMHDPTATPVRHIWFHNGAPPRSELPSRCAYSPGIAQYMLIGDSLDEALEQHQHDDKVFEDDVTQSVMVANFYAETGDGMVENTKRTFKILERLDMTADEVLVDYIAYILIRIFRELRKIKLLYAGSIFDVWLSYPLFWTPSETRKLDAAVKAVFARWAINLDGLSSLSFVHEPVAAVLHTFSDSVRFEREKRYMALEAGAMSAGAITFDIVSPKPLVIKQLVSGDGGHYGSNTVNECFEIWMKSVINQIANQGWKDYDTPLSDVYEEACERFEVIKRSFDGKKTFNGRSKRGHYSHLSHSAAPASGLAHPRGYWAVDRLGLFISNECTTRLFQQSYDGLIQLVESQLEKCRAADIEPPKAVYLLGGYGRHSHIRDALLEAFAGRLSIWFGSNSRECAVADGCLAARSALQTSTS